VWVDRLSYGGYRDWRLPTREELQSFFLKRAKSTLLENYFSNVKSWYYWTSVGFGGVNANFVWAVKPSVSYKDKNGGYAHVKTDELYVWPVRDTK